MKIGYGAVLLVLSFSGVSRATTLPDSCGSDKVKFDVMTARSGATPAPADGKAQILVFQNENQMVTPFSNATIRFGMDGNWVGATKGNSYFALTVEPGEHHLCASWQSVLPPLKKNVDLTSFTAEPGKTYYFAANVTVVSREDVEFALTPLNDDKGKYWAKAWRLSAWTTR